MAILAFMKGGLLIAVAMLSLVAGTWLAVRSCKGDVCCTLFPKIVGYAVVVVSILLILCGANRVLFGPAYHHWKDGRGGYGMRGPKGMMFEKMSAEERAKMMKDHPMMKGMMEEEDRGKRKRK